MNLKHICTVPGQQLEDMMAAYVSACLHQTAHTPVLETVRQQLASCPACAAETANALALIRWREAAAPFNRQALPVPDLPRLIGSAAGRREG